MIASMTGYGRGEAGTKSMVATAEVRGVNSRFLEINAKLPTSIAHRENEVKEIVRLNISRGKVNINITLGYKNVAEIPLMINKPAAKSYYKLLDELKKTLKLKENISLAHLLKFSEVFEPVGNEESTEGEWKVAERALVKAMEAFNAMRRKEGKELMNDLRQRITNLSQSIDAIERLSKRQIPQERARLQQRLQELLQDKSVIDANRLELEIALLADKLDVTEECVRFRSHNKLFLEVLANETAVGRKLNFLVQEMNREANTIGSKSSDAEVSHIVVRIKEELEKIREQLQNIE